jgi:hypothetical protein
MILITLTRISLENIFLPKFIPVSEINERFNKSSRGYKIIIRRKRKRSRRLIRRLLSTTTTTGTTPSSTPTTSTTSRSTSTSTTTRSTSSSPPEQNSLPRVKEFTNLDQPKNLKGGKVALRGLAGAYAFINDITGAVYIGSSINMAKRLVDHAVDKDTNVRLQNAINKYGLGNFTFAVVEIFKVDTDVSMETEITKPVY